MRAGACRGLWRDPHPGQARPAEPTYLLLHSRLQEVEKRNQGLQQELAALREELRSRGSGGEPGRGPLSHPVSITAAVGGGRSDRLGAREIVWR